jgi:hypothetical protein
MASDLRVFVGTNVVLSSAAPPAPATIETSKATGRITAIHTGVARPKHAFYAALADADYVDAGALYILPGLVECVPPDLAPAGLDPLATTAHRAAAHTCTSTSQAARTGRASRPARAPPRPAA